MLGIQEYNTSGNGCQGNGNRYGHLNGDRALYYKVAKGFVKRVKPEMRLLPDKQAREMGSLLTLRRQLMKMLIAERNRLSRPEKDVQSNIKDHIKWLKEALSDINKDLERRIQSSSS